MTVQGIPENWDPGSGTQDPGSIRGTRDQGLSTWDPGPAIHRQDPGPRARDLYLRSENWDTRPLRAARDPYLVTLTLIQLSLHVQFSSIA